MAMSSEGAQKITLEHDCQNKPITAECKSHWKVQNRSRVIHDTCSSPWKRNKGLGQASPLQPHWLFVKCNSTSTALGCTWWERSRTRIPSGQGRNRTGMSSSRHRAKTGSHRKWECPPSLQRCPLCGAKDQQSPQRTVMVLISTPKEKLLRAPNGHRVAVLKIRMTQLWSESFYFCILASVIWFPSYSLNHSEICFCRQGQLCHSCFPNFKLEDIH